MSNPFRIDAGARYAFAPSRELVEGSPHRVCIVFEGSDDRQWTAGTELMAVTCESEEDMCDQLNRPLGLDYAGWTAFGRRVFAAHPYRKDD